MILNLNNLKDEMKKHFGDRVIIPEKFSIKKMSAREYHKEELERVRSEDLDYYSDFKDNEIPLITDDVYASAYRFDLDTQKFTIIDSFMNVEDFNLNFLKNNINNKTNFVIADCYGEILMIDKY